jgi:glycosyltransferase involved in cell wall biosynthesis
MTQSDGKINILYLRDTDKVCGPGKTMINTHRTIDQHRFSVTLCVTGVGKNGKNDFIESAEKAGAHVVYLKMGGYFDVLALLRLIGLLKRLRIDILQTHDAQTRRIGVIAAWLTGIPHVSSLHGWIQNNQIQKLSVVLDKYLIRFSKKVIVMSDAMKREIISAGVSSKKVITLHNAVLLEDYPIRRSSSKIRTEFHIKDDEKVVAIIGRLSPEKRHDLFLQMASQVVKKNPKVKFLIVGDGPLIVSLKKFVEELNLTNHVIFTGHRTDIIDMYSAIDILVISSDTEGLPNVLLEAFACCKPVVATRVGGIPEILINDQNGFLTEPHDLTGLIDRVLFLLNNTQLAIQMGLNGRKEIENRLSFKNRTLQLEKCYRDILQKPGIRS